MTFVPRKKPDIYTSPDGDFEIRQGLWDGHDRVKTYRAGLRYPATRYRKAYPPNGQYMCLPEPLTLLALALVDALRQPHRSTDERNAAALRAFEAALYVLQKA